MREVTGGKPVDVCGLPRSLPGLKTRRERGFGSLGAERMCRAGAGGGRRAR